MNDRAAACDKLRTPDPYWLLDVRRPGDQDRLDVRVESGRIAAVVDHGAGDADAAHVDADGRWIVPGLYDGHVHATQYAIDRSRIDLSGAASAAEAVKLVADALDHGEVGWNEAIRDRVPVVGAGFRDGFWPDLPSRQLLDQRFGDLAVVMISGDLHCGWASTAGLAMLGVGDHETGVLREKPWMDALARLPQPSARRTDAVLDDALRQAAARGLVGLRDFEFADNLSSWERRRSRGGVPLRIETGIIPELLKAGMARGMRTGDLLPGTDGLITMGQLKVLVDGSLNTRTAFCRSPYPDAGGHGELMLEPDALIDLMEMAKRHGLQIAVHAIGDRANGIALDCFQRTGIRGRIEHAQLLDPVDLPRFAELGVIASMQPWHAIDDWRMADHYWRASSAVNFAFASLAAAGAAIEFGSDAPVAPLDPWGWIAAAVDREPIIGRPWHPDEQISIHQAIAYSTLGRGTIAAGQPADLVLLDQDPYQLSAKELITIGVHGTAVAGRWVHGPDAEG